MSGEALTIVWAPASERDLGRLQPQVAARVERAVEHFALTGRGDVIRLTARVGLARLRVGDWRVILRVGADSLEVVRVLLRWRAYR